MRLLIATSARYFRAPTGEIWTETPYDQEMWREYQAGFEEVGIITRVLDRAPVTGIARPAGGTGICFYPLPEWNSRQALLRLPQMMQVAREAVSESDAVWLHSPSIEADLVYLWARRLKKPACVECRGDQVMSSDYWKKRGMGYAACLGRYFKWQFQRHLRHAWGCIFVSEDLRKIYQADLPGDTRVEVISDVRIRDSFFRSPQVMAGPNRKVLNLVNVGRLETQKDQATLIKAFALLQESRLADCVLHLVGEGALRPNLLGLARAYGVEEKVVFHGFVSWGEPLFNLLDQMDLFVLSSINEGMPRALLEAMAHGLPCISTAVSGASELLPPEMLVPCGRADELAGRILEILQTPGALDRNAAQCWQRVQAFKIPHLVERKVKFLQEFRESISHQKIPFVTPSDAHFTPGSQSN